MGPDAPLGATLGPNANCRFNIWAPFAEEMSIELLDRKPRSIALQKDAYGYHLGEAEGVQSGDRYWVMAERPAPASRPSHAMAVLRPSVSCATPLFHRAALG